MSLGGKEGGPHTSPEYRYPLWLTTMTFHITTLLSRLPRCTAGSLIKYWERKGRWPRYRCCSSCSLALTPHLRSHHMYIMHDGRGNISLATLLRWHFRVAADSMSGVGRRSFINDALRFGWLQQIPVMLWRPAYPAKKYRGHLLHQHNARIQYRA